MPLHTYIHIFVCTRAREERHREERHEQRITFHGAHFTHIYIYNIRTYTHTDHCSIRIRITRGEIVKRFEARKTPILGPPATAEEKMLT